MPCRSPLRRPRGRKTRDGLTRALRRNGIPRDPDPKEPLPKRLLKSKFFWLTVVMILVYVTMLVLLYQKVVPDREVPGGTLPGLGTEAIPIAFKYAAVTAIPLSLLFLWADRYRPQRFWVWLMTFGWGACVATYVSAEINSWAAGHLSIIGDGDPATAARAAIYVAPFVEEASKATVLFWLAILMRYQWVSRLSGIVLAGLSGAAFAFTENILYYGRVYRYAARTFGEVPPLEALQNLFVLRGLVTFLRSPALHRDDRHRAGYRAALQEQDRSGCRTARRLLPRGLLAYGVQHCGKPDAGQQSALHLSGGCAAPRSGHDHLHRSPAVPRGPVDPGTSHRLRPARLAARKRSQEHCRGCGPAFGHYGMHSSRVPTHSLPPSACSARLPSWHICGMP